MPPDLDAILDAAARLTSCDADFSMETLAAEAAVSRATLYRTFGGKAGVRDALRARGLEIAEPSDAPTRILDAARRVFLTDGIGRTTIERVAQEAGVGPATVYRHFGDKQGLVSALSEHSPARRADREGRLVPGPDYEDRLIALTTELITTLHANGRMFAVAVVEAEEYAELFGAIRDRPGRTRALLIGYLDALVAAGHLPPHDTEVLATTLLGACFAYGWLVPFLHDDGVGDAAELARKLVPQLLDGVRR